MKINEVFKNIDSKIFESKDVEKKLTEAFETAVNESAEEKAKVLFESKEKEYQDSLDEIIESVTKTIELDQKDKFNEVVKETVSELFSEKEKSLEEEFKKNMKNEIDEMLDKNEKFIDYAVQQFVEEAMPKWQEEKKVLEASKIMEEFTTLSEAFGVKVSKINESDEISKANSIIEKSIDENIELKKKINFLECETHFNESTEDLSVVQKDKLKSLMEDFSDLSIDKYKSKLDLYKSTVVESNLNGSSNHKTNSSRHKKPSWA